jgi:hypothetical protein
MEILTYEIARIFSVFLVLMLLFLVPAIATRRKPTPEKNRTYLCGEKIPYKKVCVPSSGFYWAIRDFFKPFYKTVGKWHSGKLSDYLVWLLAALLIIVVVVIAWV